MILRKELELNYCEPNKNEDCIDFQNENVTLMILF